MALSFEEAFEAEFASLHRYLRRRVGPSAADDLAAQTFATAFTEWNRFDPSRPLRPWLYGIAANLVRHYWGAERRMIRAYTRTGVDPVLTADDESIERVDADARRRALAAALAELRPRDREHAWGVEASRKARRSGSSPSATSPTTQPPIRRRCSTPPSPSAPTASSARSPSPGEPGRTP